MDWLLLSNGRAANMATYNAKHMWSCHDLPTLIPWANELSMRMIPLRTASIPAQG